MALLNYELRLDREHIVLKVPKHRPVWVYAPGKSRVKLHSDVKFHLGVMGIHVNDETLHADLDRQIWDHVPRRLRYE